MTAVAAADVDVGLVDQKAPKKGDLTIPKSDDGVPAVELRAPVKCKQVEGEKRKLYVLVTPLSAKDYTGTWWV